MAIDRTKFPKLGFGMMRLPAISEGVYDIEQVKNMVDSYINAGMNYFDTAYMYCGGQSECIAKEALVQRYPRDSFYLTSKLPCGEIKSYEDRDRVLNHQLEKTGAGYFDIYLMHGVQDNNVEEFERFDCFNWGREQIAAGKIKHLGFSFHGTPECLEKVLDKYPFIEVVQIQLNYRDMEAPAINSRRIYEILAERNIPIIVMEPVKGGSLASTDAETEAAMNKVRPGASVASFALRFVASLPAVMITLSGMSNEEQMNDNIKTFKNFEPLTDEEQDIIAAAVEKLNSSPVIPCTACRYCTKGCPMQINIPEIIRAVNAQRIDPKQSRADGYFKMIIDGGSGRPSACVGCGQCERICPQHLSIIDAMKEAAEKFE